MKDTPEARRARQSAYQAGSRAARKAIDPAAIRAEYEACEKSDPGSLRPFIQGKRRLLNIATEPDRIAFLKTEIRIGEEILHELEPSPMS